MPPAPWRAARGSGMAPEAPGTRRAPRGKRCPEPGHDMQGQPHAGQRETGSGNPPPQVRRGAAARQLFQLIQPGKLIPLGEPSASGSSRPRGARPWGVPRAAGRWERQGALGEALPALPARASSRNPAGKAAAALGWGGTIPVPAPARTGAPWHGPSSGPVPAPIRSPAGIPGWDLGRSLPRGPVPHALGWVGVGMWPAKPRDGPSQEFPSQ